MTLLLNSLSSKWAMPVLYRLLLTDRPMRFTELKNTIGKIAQKELTRTLREFERVGLVLRRAYREAPPRVEYELTALGASLRVPLLALADWASDHARELGAEVPPLPSIQPEPVLRG